MDPDSLKSVSLLPKCFQGVFSFRYFNAVQSEVYQQVYESDGNIVVSAPTGSGKTVLFELAVLRVLTPFITEEEELSPPLGRAKVVYVAPMKALVQERLRAWSSSFGRLGVTSEELTGDSGIDDLSKLQRADIILTTPEKFDSLTRRNRHLGGLGWMGDVSLLLIDEVHLLSDPRGAALEAVVSRMKMIAQYPEMREYPISKLRLVAVSATMPNIQDIAEWLKATGPGMRRFGEEMRPVKLVSSVVGYTPAKNDFMFEKKLQQFLPDAIRRNSHGRPTLVFCSTRKGARDAALHLGSLVNNMGGQACGFSLTSAQRERLHVSSVTAIDKQLQSCLTGGVGFHNGGLEPTDRALVEGLFLRGDLHVLCTTGTLAVGVNLPAHLVVIKSTQYFNKERGGYIEYERSAILQMAGRAGRPQFDLSGHVLIMTRQDTVHLYRNLLVGSEPIESGLLPSITEHLNAEIVLLTVTDVSLAVDWLKNSFLYVRLRKNPKFYGLPPNLSDEQLKMKLRGILLSSTRALTECGMITTDDDGFLLRPAEPGRLMAHFYLSFKTMQAITQVKDVAAEDSLLWVIADSSELSWIKLRRSEKKALNNANCDRSGRIKFQVLDGAGKLKKRIQHDREKIFVLANDALSGEPSISDFTLIQDVASICQNGSRIANCMSRYFLWCKRYSEAVASLKLAKCLTQKLWEDSHFLLRQLPGVGNVTAKALVSAGLESFDKVQQADPRKLEAVTGRKYPFGNQLRESLEALPPCIGITINANQQGSDRVEIVLLRPEGSKAKGKACWADLVVGEATTNKVLYHEHIRTDSFNSPYVVLVNCQGATSLGSSLKATLVYENYAGRDSSATSTLPGTRSKLKIDVSKQSHDMHLGIPQEVKHLRATPSTARIPEHFAQEDCLPDFEPPSFVVQPATGVSGNKKKEPDEWKADCKKRKQVPSESIFQHIAQKSHQFPVVKSSFLPHRSLFQDEAREPVANTSPVTQNDTRATQSPGQPQTYTGGSLAEDWGQGSPSKKQGGCAGISPSTKNGVHRSLYCAEWHQDKGICRSPERLDPGGPPCKKSTLWSSARQLPPLALNRKDPSSTDQASMEKHMDTSVVRRKVTRSFFDDLFKSPCLVTAAGLHGSIHSASKDQPTEYSTSCGVPIHEKQDSRKAVQFSGSAPTGATIFIDHPSGADSCRPALEANRTGAQQTNLQAKQGFPRDCPKTSSPEGVPETTLLQSIAVAQVTQQRSANLIPTTSVRRPESLFSFL